MKRLNGAFLIRDDRLLRTWWDKDRGQRLTQGKRVAHDCPLTRDEIRSYVESNGDSITAIRYLMDKRNLGLAEAKQLFDSARRPAFVHGRQIA